MVLQKIFIYENLMFHWATKPFNKGSDSLSKGFHGSGKQKKKTHTLSLCDKNCKTLPVKLALLIRLCVTLHSVTCSLCNQSMRKHIDIGQFSVFLCHHTGSFTGKDRNRPNYQTRPDRAGRA